MTQIFNPFLDKAKAKSLHHREMAKQTRGFKRFCCKCSQEKTTRGGTFPSVKGGGPGSGSGSGHTEAQMLKFICADCQPKEKTGA